MVFKAGVNQQKGLLGVNTSAALLTATYDLINADRPALRLSYPALAPRHTWLG